MRRLLRLPEEIRQLIDLIESGKLFEVQDWIKEGKPLRTPPDSKDQVNVLKIAVQTRFHSMVQVLLKEIQWNPSELAEALNQTVFEAHYEFAELIIQHGAPVQDIDFYDVCRTADRAMMKLFLRSGVNPSKENAFARALLESKAKPLLGFYRDHAEKFPQLSDQISLALCEAIRTKDRRWSALLAWAGADPYKKVPWRLEEEFPVDPENSNCTANLACYYGDFEIFRSLKLKLNCQQAIELMGEVSFTPNTDILKSLLSFIPKEKINHTQHQSCSLLEKMIEHSHWPYGDHAETEKSRIAAIEILVDHGARWNPPPDQLRYVRKALGSYNSQYVVQVLRLLIYSRDAADFGKIWQICHGPKIRELIKTGDPMLWNEIMDLRKSWDQRCCNQNG